MRGLCVVRAVIAAGCLTIGIGVLCGHGLCAGGTDKPGSRALGICPANLHCFQTADGAPVLLVGNYTWGTFSEIDFDYDLMFRTLQANGLNFSRVWLWWGCEVLPETPERVDVVPYLRTGPGNANDGKPKYDLTRFNPLFFDRLRRFCAAARSRGIFLQLIVFDAWMLKHPNLWKLHAYQKDNNINAVDGDPRGTGRGIDGKQGFCSLGNQGVLGVQEAYIQRVIDAVSDFDNVFFEVANENYYNAEWERRLCEYIHEYERSKPRQHLAMPLDVPNHDWGKIKTWDIERLHANMIIARALRQPLIFDNDGLGHPDDATVRRAAWTAFVSGGNTDYLDDSLQPGSEYHGDEAGMRRATLRGQLGHLARFARETCFWDMHPDDSLIQAGRGFALASAREAVVYLPEGGAVTVDPARLGSLPTGQWFNPRTGKASDAFAIGAATVDLAPPGAGDWVLHVTVTGR
jgi:hypothetical protein